MNAMRSFLAIVSVATASACSTIVPAPQTHFLASYGALEPDGDGGSASRRSAVVIDPARLTLRDIEWHAGAAANVDDADRLVLLEHLRAALVENVSRMPPAPDGHPAVLRAAITQVDTVSPALNVVSALFLFAPLDGGGAVVEIEALEPDTEKQLAARTLRYYPPVSEMRIRFSKLAPAQLALRKAAADFIALLSPAVMPGRDK
jgi:hypothetical protein